MTQNYFEAEDLAQETFLSAYKHLDTFERNYEKAWISKIALHKCLDYQKQAARKIQVVEEKQLYDLLPSVEYVEHEVVQEDMMQQLKRACLSLKSPYREIAIAYFYEEREMKDIAQMYDKNLKTVQTQVYRAKAMLKKLYGKELLR